MKTTLLSAVILSAVAASAQAATSYYSDATVFAADAGSLSFEGFEGSTQNGPTHTYTDFSVSETGGTNYITNFVSNPFFNPVQAGSNGIWYDDNGSSVGEFVFNSTINAIGLFVSTAAASTISVSFGGETTTFDTDTTPTFFGLIADVSFTNISFDASGGPEVGFDSVSYGTASQPPAVPLPASSLLLMAGVGGLTTLRRKRKTA